MVREHFVDQHDCYRLVTTIRVSQGAKGVLSRQLTPNPIVSSESARELCFDTTQLAKVGVNRQQ